MYCIVLRKLPKQPNLSYSNKYVAFPSPFNQPKGSIDQMPNPAIPASFPPSPASEPIGLRIISISPA